MPVTTPEQFGKYLSAPEGTRLEFKAARMSYEFDKLVNYCVALANEGGGTMILGVSDKRPRSVVGTTAFPEPGEMEASLHRVFNHRIPIEEYHHEGKRVLIVHVPSRLPGTAWQHDGKYLKRAGDALVPMGDQELRTIFAETGPDFTAEIVPHAGLGDLQPEALNRCGFIERSGQGVNLMIEQAVRQTKPLPDLSKSAAHEVFLVLAGTVPNPAFLRFIERLGEDALSRFQTLDFLALDALAHGRGLTREMKSRLADLIEAGAVESQGRG
jgi:predicted HTH transcriptional regulator